MRQQGHTIVKRDGDELSNELGSALDPPLCGRWRNKSRQINPNMEQRLDEKVNMGPLLGPSKHDTKSKTWGQKMQEKTHPLTKQVPETN